MSPTPFPLHTAPAAGFDQPFELLGACHDRVRRMLALLQRLQAHLAAHGADAQARDAAADVARYFDLAAPHHHEDEERHLFPRLKAAGRYLPEVARLQAEHLAMAETWATRARPVLAAVAAGHWPPPDQTSEAAQAGLQAFASLYVDHLVTEDGLVFPAAQALVGAEDQAAMGREMAARRGASTAA